MNDTSQVLKNTGLLLLLLKQSTDDHRLLARLNVENVVDIARPAAGKFPLEICRIVHGRPQRFKTLVVEVAKLLHIAMRLLYSRQGQEPLIVLSLVGSV